MKINFNKNKGFMRILNEKVDDFLVDANIFIPPDRSSLGGGCRAIAFEYYKNNWIIPFINTFKPVGIHQAVYDEFVVSKVKEFVDLEIKSGFLRICIHDDSMLTPEQEIHRATVEEAIAKNTNYNPIINNKDDKGEVKSLAYIQTRELLYFCSHDANAIRLIENAEKLDTYLEEVSAIQPYEIMYYFAKNNIGDIKAIKNLYKYLYRLTHNEKIINPEWNEFVEKMDIIYFIELDK